MILVVFGLLAYFQLAASLAQHEITFLIISQKDSYNLKNALQLRDDIIAQTSSQAASSSLLPPAPPNIILSHELLTSASLTPIAGSWAITPILKNIQQTLLTAAKWLIICEDQSVVNLTALLHHLQAEDYTADRFLGHPLSDVEATIVHHFAFFENPSWFLYPLFRAGVALSMPLLTKLSQRLDDTGKFNTEFFIDASHELALFVWDNGMGNKLTPTTYFCSSTVEASEKCAVYTRPYATCDNSVSLDRIFFAVKTCHRFHVDRVPVIKATWAAMTKHIRYYSDFEDKAIPTITTNVINTDTGHCQKLLVIFQLILEELESTPQLSNIEWIVLADDDTLLSVPHISDMLGCYNATDDIYLGERYGYRLMALDGFNYITGGGGIVFSISTIQKLVKECICPSDSSPDDMIVAVCLQRIGVEPIHSSRFHQARPPDYAAAALHETRPISFHKFWQIDPYDVYARWLTDNGISDRQTIPLENLSTLAKKPNHSSNNDQKDDDNQIRCSPPMDCSGGANKSTRPGDVIKILNSNKHKEL